MRQIAIYGKGGIGKSMVSSHISFALAKKGLKVLHVGCDPKHDSTRLLLKGMMPETILETLREKDFNIKAVSMNEVIFESAFKSECAGEIYCAESGGPDPGVGCGGKGVVEAIEALKHLNVFETLKLDAVLYDVLGDVVCGGFSMPIREGYAKEIYIVSSGEIEVLFAASNIFKAIRRFNPRSGAQLGGIIGNLRELKNEQTNTDGVCRALRHPGRGLYSLQRKDQGVLGQGGDPFPACAGYTPECEAFRSLADRIWENTQFSVPRSMSFEELHRWWSKGKK